MVITLQTALLSVMVPLALPPYASTWDGSKYGSSAVSSTHSPELFGAPRSVRKLNGRLFGLSFNFYGVIISVCLLPWLHLRILTSFCFVDGHFTSMTGYGF